MTMKDGWMGLPCGGGKGRRLESEETHPPMARVGGNGKTSIRWLCRPGGVD